MDRPPQLGDLPQTSDFKIPTLSGAEPPAASLSASASASGPAASTAQPTTTSSSSASTAQPAPAVSSNPGISSSNTVVSGSSPGVSSSHTGVSNSATSVAGAPASTASSTPIKSEQNTSSGLAGSPSTVGQLKTTVTSSEAAARAVANHPTTQSLKESVQQAPVTGVVKDQHAKTTAELNNLAAARKTPGTTTANNQPLTHYHSFFYTLLSWENPRVTGIAFLASILVIFTLRYLPALRWALRATYLLLGATAAAEIVGRLAFSQGLASSIRPKRYYTIPRENLEASLEDAEQLINFFVIEFQRILFAENVLHTSLAFIAALVSYWLIKIVPLWGLALIGTSVLYLAPLIYVTNRELIDEQMQHASDLVNAQALQVRDLAGQHTAKATETLKGYAGDYTTKAQEMLGSARGGRTSIGEPSPSVSSTSTKANGQSNGSLPAQSSAGTAYKSSDFPTAPKNVPVSSPETTRQAQPAY